MYDYTYTMIYFLWSTGENIPELMQVMKVDQYKHMIIWQITHNFSYIRHIGFTTIPYSYFEFHVISNSYDFPWKAVKLIQRIQYVSLLGHSLLECCQHCIFINWLERQCVHLCHKFNMILTVAIYCTLV